MQNDIKPDTAEHDGRVKEYIQGGYGRVWMWRGKVLVSTFPESEIAGEDGMRLSRSRRRILRP